MLDDYDKQNSTSLSLSHYMSRGDWEPFGHDRPQLDSGIRDRHSGLQGPYQEHALLRILVPLSCS